MITAIVGSGGKTTLIHKLASQYVNEGKKVFVTTTTHMYVENDTLLTDDASQIIDKLNNDGYAMAGVATDNGCSIKGTGATGNANVAISNNGSPQFYDKDLVNPMAPKTKFSALSDSTYSRVCTYADEVLIEADGSKQLPLKFPNATEPVIPENVDRIIVVSNLAGLNHKASEVVHRLAEAQKYISIEEDTLITPLHVQELIRKGYIEPLMEKYTGKEISLHINNNGSLYERAVASLIEADMDVNILDPGWFAPKPCLFICGGGHVARELGEIASKLDFRIHVIDSRPDFANKERFPFAERVICDKFESLGDYLVKDAFYAVVTPGHQADYTCVKAICDAAGNDDEFQYRYLGMIGSRGKIAKTFDLLRDNGISDSVIDEIHAPIGLPIGAATPAEIAISILAEIIQVKNKAAFSSASAELLNSTKSGMLCIIIDKTGSAPRGIGSMMLVTDDEQLDTIGGGAIENAAIEDARKTHSAFIQEYRLNESDTVRLGMICGGTNKILFIPV